jgi:hypothetical protein
VRRARDRLAQLLQRRQPARDAPPHQQPRDEDQHELRQDHVDDDLARERAPLASVSATWHDERPAVARTACSSAMRIGWSSSTLS